MGFPQEDRHEVTISGYTRLYKLVWSGTLDAAGVEVFSYSRHAALANLTGEDDFMDDAALDVASLLAESTTGSTPFSTLAQIFPESVSWTLLKGYSISLATGENLSAEPLVRELADAGTSAAQRLTNQDALAITTQAAPVASKRKTNRFYLPTMVTGVLEDDGHVTGTLIDDIQTQLDLANTAHIAATGSWQYCIHSPKAHTIDAIARYHSGDVMDTIRRRRNKLIEARHDLAVS